MDKKYFAFKLIPPRPDFAQTMTDDERATMKAHSLYWRKQMETGVMLIFGPVLDPSGTYGLGILTGSTYDEIKPLVEGDPAIGLCTYTCFPMLAVVPER